MTFLEELRQFENISNIEVSYTDRLDYSIPVPALKLWGSNIQKTVDEIIEKYSLEEFTFKWVDSVRNFAIIDLYPHNFKKLPKHIQECFLEELRKYKQKCEANKDDSYYETQLRRVTQVLDSIEK